VAGVIAFVGLPVLHADARYLYDGLTSRALAVVILSAICGIATLVLLVRHNHRGARLAAIGAVASIVVAWGVAQWHYMLPTSLTVAQAASPDGSLETILGVTVVAVLIIFPALGLLYTLDQRGLLSGEGVEDAIDATSSPTT
jgi:cytochrome bd ubiquinol oxidase subunit II